MARSSCPCSRRGAKRGRRGVSFADRFIAHMLARNIRVEDDLVDQLFNAYNGRIRINQSLLSVVLHD